MSNSMAAELESMINQQLEETTKPTVPDYFNYHLNDYSVSEIFKYLSIKQRLDIAKVCKGARWREASQFAWRDIKTLDFEKPSPFQEHTDELPPAYRTNKCIARILNNCGRSLRQLKLQNPADLNILQVIKQYCSNLTKLDVDVSFCDTSIAEVISSLPNLEYLRLNGNGEQLSPDFFEALPIATLTEIHLLVNDAEPFPSDTILSRIPLKILKDLTKLTAISLEGFSIAANVLQVISQKTQLTHLALPYCYTRIDLSSLILLPNLTYLDLSYSSSLNDELLMEFSRNCQRLKILKLNCCDKITDDGILYLLILPQLEELELYSNSITGAFLSLLHHLKKLDVSCCDISDDIIIGFMENAPNLEHLNVTHTNVSEKVLRVAGRITRNRIANHGLEVIVNCSMKYNWQSCAHNFSLLTVDVHEFDRDKYNTFFARRQKKRIERQRRNEKHRLKLAKGSGY